MSLRGPLAAVLSVVLALGAVGLTAAPASAASVAGTITPGAVPDDTDFGPTFTDEEGTTDIPGVTYESFFSGDGVTPTGNVLGWALTSGAPTTLVQRDPVAAFTVRTDSGVPFALTSFAIQDAQWLKATYTATGYNDGTIVATSDFTVPEVAAPVTITLAPEFQFVDAVRITSTGHAQEPGMLWQEGFRDIVVADPVYPTTLSALSLSAGALLPAFSATEPSYTLSVPNSTSSTTVTPTTTDTLATVTVNGVSVPRGAASGSIALNVGSNTITTIVTAGDGSATRTYTTTVTRAAPPSSNNRLSALSLSTGTLAPAFASGTTAYNASVSNSTTSIAVMPTVADATATVTVNGVATTSGNASGAIALAVGSNTITVRVTAQNGTALDYTVTVTRVGSANANLSALSLSSGTLSPAFAAGTTSYNASVSNATTSLTVTPTITDGTASVTVNGVAVASGNASGAIALNVGANTITTIVTAQDGTTTKAYTVTVTRAASSNANLSALALSSGTMSPVFNAATTGYTASIAAGVSSLTVTPTVAASTASVTVNGVAVSSGAASAAIAMNTGSNTVTVVVTAQNSATKTYTVTITRALPSANADLSALSIPGAALSPAFATGTTSYTALVGNAITSLTVTPTVADATATVTVDGTATVSGAASDAIALAVGTTVITTKVTAQDGTTTKTYTVAVTRAPSSDSSLASLALTDATISPAFDPSITGYAASVANSVSSVTVAATSTPTSTLTINGATTTNVPLAVGANSITVRVTAQDGTSTDYVITVSRAFVAPGFTDAALGSMQVGVVFADSVSAVGTPVIGYAVTSGALPAGIALDPATGAVTGTPTAPGAYDVTISATSPYAAATARITGTVLAAPIAPVVPTPTVELVPGFTAGTPLAQATLSVSGANLVPGSDYTIVLYSDPVVLARGAIDATGTLSFSTKLPAGVEAGAHRLVLTVVAPDGSVASDTVWFTVLSSGIIGAVSLVQAVPYAEPTAAGKRELASTGADEWLVAKSSTLAALLLAAGFALMLVRRRRSGEIG